MNRKSVAKTKLAAWGLAFGMSCFIVPGLAMAQTPQPPQTDPKHAPAEKIEPCPGQKPGSLDCGAKSKMGTPPAAKKALPKHPVQHAPLKHAAAKKPADGDLSKKLQQSHGTIKPPATVDPGMAATPPHDGGDHSMPVIPPPGSPGGNPHVVPQ